MTASAATVVDTIRRRIAAAEDRAGRAPGSTRLLAVSKTVPAERVAPLLAAGIMDLGENRVQEALAKQEALGRQAVRWHLVGHLQTNKASRAAGLFDTVHSIDSERIARALADRRPAELPPLEAFVEVELTGIPGRTGVAADGAEDILRAVASLPGMHLAGLMTMAPQGPTPEHARPWFAQLRRARDDLQQRTGLALPGLSMGMSEDFEVAVEEGSTIVRVGRALFGPRPPHG